MNNVEFFVPGLPATAGSKTGFVNKKTGAVIITPANKRQKPWMSDVKYYAEKAMGVNPLFACAIHLYLDFYFTRPKGHYGTGKNIGRLKLSAPEFHITKPDLTKLTRAVEDALKGVIWKDDSQVTSQTIKKHYWEKPGVKVYIAKCNYL